MKKASPLTTPWTKRSKEQYFQTLVTYMQTSASIKHEVGKHDCATFLAGWVDILGGTNYRDELRESYDNKVSGLLRLTDKGDIAKAVKERIYPAGFAPLDTSEIPLNKLALFAGDIVFCENKVIGIYTGNGIAQLVEHCMGLLILHRSHAAEVWRFEPSYS